MSISSLWLADTDPRIEIQETLRVSGLLASKHGKGVGNSSSVSSRMADYCVHSDHYLFCIHVRRYTYVGMIE